MKINIVILTLAVIASVPFAAHGSVLFSDDYSTNTIGNYTTTDEADGLVSTWAVGSGTLNYTRTGNTGYSTSNLLSNIASTSGLVKFQTSGDLLNLGGGGTQQGLVVTGDNTSGGFVVQKWDGGSGHLVLMQQAGANLHGDEGSTVVLDFGMPTNGDSYHVSARVDRSGTNPFFDVTITDLTTHTVFNHLSGFDTNVLSSFGGTDIGWRTRASSDSVSLSFDNLQLQSVPEPSTFILAGLGLVGSLVAARRRKA